MITLAEAIISLGSNLAEKEQNIKHALESINLIPETKVIRVSKLYETLPFGVPNEQPNYLNCCAIISTELSPQILLGALLGIEAAMGRERKFRFCERIIDIDLIFYENEKINQKNLTLPHPRAFERAFVLVPLADICKNMQFKNINFREDYERCDKSILIEKNK
ncbi:MAG: 2-amino-4-hydroxy-6-hydroxymethyldihydropteridine diphosphokinase [Clostridia bacterium]|nr:2-amino-4-hydroxy-6-hydroxymethyldihydropteridine diphosphokinase [Clostridia bacterium]